MLFEAILGHPLIQEDDVWGLLAVLCLSVGLSIWLEQTYKWASKVSGPVIALVLAMVMANVGIIPVNSTLYDDIVWSYILPLGIPLLLLQCNLKKIWRDTGKMLIVWIFAAVGTTISAFVGYYLLATPFGDSKGLAQVGAMMTGSYIGGGVNFAAMAAAYEVDGTLIGAATVADNLLMTLYFFVLFAVAASRFFLKRFTHPHIDHVASESQKQAAQTQAAAFWGPKEVSLIDFAKNFAYAATVVWVARLIAGVFSPLAVGGVPSGVDEIVKDFIGQFLGNQYVWISTLSMIVATFFDKQAAKLHGTQEIGTYLIYLFLFVIGCPANIYLVITEAPLLLLFCFIMIVFNMAFSFFSAKIFKADLEDAILVSNATIGGPPTAAGMAIAMGWSKLAGPALLIGVLGYVTGNYFGTIVGIVLGA